MAWIKIPAEHHALFLAALPRDPRVSTRRMFGSVVGMANGHLFSGLFARSIMVKVGDADRAEALALDGSEPFDPMGTGRGMGSAVLLAEEVMDDPQVMRDWIRRAFEHVVTLPPKQKAKAKPVAAAKKQARAAPRRR